MPTATDTTQLLFAEPFSATPYHVDDDLVIVVAGELDMASRDVMFAACVEETGRDVQIDLHCLVFLDCAGYSAIIAARNALRAHGGVLTVSSARGEPARLLARFEHRPG